MKDEGGRVHAEARRRGGGEVGWRGFLVLGG